MSEVANPLEGLRLDGDALGEPQSWMVVSRGLEYPGEVIVAETGNPDWGRPLEGDLLFKIVLYTVPRRIPPDQIRDPRIAMAVPRRAPDVVQQSVGRQLQAIREAKERYAAGHDPDSQAIRESMAGQESSLQSDLARREAHSYSQGRVYTQSGLAIRASEIFTETAAATWVERLVRAVHQLAYPTLPIEYAEFPGVLDAARVEEVFRGILQGDVAGADSARGFDAGGCEVVDIIGVELESRAGEMAAADLVQSLCLDHGLNRDLATLYLLAFVLHARAEVTLSSDHSVKLGDDGPLLSDRITWDLIQEIRFVSSLSDHLSAVRARPALVWNAVLPYATILDREMGPTDDEANIARQDGRLAAALSELGERVTESREHVTSLASALGESTGPALSTLDQLQVVCSATGYRGFHDVAQSSFGGPSGLRMAMDLFRRLERLGDLAPAITRAQLYLDEMTFGDEHEVLRLQRDSAIGRMALSELLHNPSLWESIEGSFVHLRREYARVYLEDHAGYHEEAVELIARLEGLGAQVEAVSRFNEVPEFGGPLADEAPRRFRDLIATIKTCTVREADVDLDEAPICRECSLSLDDNVPRRESAKLRADIEWAMRKYNGRLSSEAVRRILAHPTGEQLDRFINLVQVSDLTALSNVLDSQVLDFLRRFVSDR